MTTYRIEKDYKSLNWIHFTKNPKKRIEFANRYPGQKYKKYTTSSMWDSIKQFNSEKQAKSYLNKYLKEGDYGC